MKCKLTSKGQVTLPKALRHKLHLKVGDEIYFDENEKGEFVLKPKTLPVSALKGLFKYDGPSISIEDMNEAIAEGASSWSE